MWKIRGSKRERIHRPKMIVWTATAIDFMIVPHYFRDRNYTISCLATRCFKGIGDPPENQHPKNQRRNLGVGGSRMYPLGLVHSLHIFLTRMRCSTPQQKITRTCHCSILHSVQLFSTLPWSFRLHPIETFSLDTCRRLHLAHRLSNSFRRKG